MKVTLLYSPAARQVLECELELPTGSTLEDALRLSGWLDQHPELGVEASVSCGIWGRKAPRESVLRDRDRIEFWRPLRVDPKAARRQRFKSQGAKTAGLFAQRRQGAKWGY